MTNAPSSSLDHVVARIDQCYSSMRSSEAAVADLFRRETAWFLKASLAEIAVASGVGEGSVSRFCKAIGFEGLRALRAAFDHDATR